MARSFSRSLRHTKIDTRIVLVGHSYGGNVISTAATHASCPVRRPSAHARVADLAWPGLARGRGLRDGGGLGAAERYSILVHHELQLSGVTTPRTLGIARKCAALFVSATSAVIANETGRSTGRMLCTRSGASGKTHAS